MNDARQIRSPGADGSSVAAAAGAPGTPIDGRPGRSPLALLSAAVLVTCGFIVFVIVSASIAQRESAAAHRLDRRIEELRGRILHWDEVLTMSALMAAATGEPAWEQRYARYEPMLGQAIGEAIDLAPDAAGAAATEQTDEAKQALVAIERRAFELVRQDRRAEAMAALTGEAYQRHKTTYSRGMAQLDEALKRVVDERQLAQSRRIWRRLLYGAGAVGLMIAAWMQVLRLTGRWQRALIALSARLQAKAAKLAELNATLDARIARRSQQLGAEMARRQAAQRERQSLKDAMSAMERVLAVVGHELRTPLAALRVSSELLLDAGAGALAGADALLQSIHLEVVRMAGLVNNLLEAARLNSGVARWNWSEVDIAGAAERAVDLIRPLIDASSVTLACDVPPGIGMRGDAEAVQRLLINLLGNSARHTARGSIDLRVRALMDDERRWIDIEVADSGTGISESVLRKLGQAFVLNSGVVGSDYVHGSGLGLAICKGIIAAHGGRLTVQSQVGAGATVNVILRADLAGPQDISETQEAPEILEATP